MLGRVRRVNEPFDFASFGVERVEAERQFFDGSANLLFDFFELLAAYFVEARIVRTGVFRQPVHLIDGQIKHCPFAIAYGNVILLHVAHFLLDGSFADTYAVHLMNHIIPRFRCD